LARGGATIAEISRLLECDRSAVERRLKRIKIEPRKGWRIADVTANMILRERSEGKTNSEIADKFGIGITTIRRRLNPDANHDLRRNRKRRSFQVMEKGVISAA
jgi:DNA invertase Pin-like site-specific DNA recombinase